MANNWMFVGAAFVVTWGVVLGYLLHLERTMRRAREHLGRRDRGGCPMSQSTIRTKRLVIGGAAVIVAVFGYLLYGGIDKNIVYFLTPHELLAKGTKAQDVPVRLGGQIKPGSVKWNEATLDLSFIITDGTSDIAVHSTGAPPQMFRDGMGVVVEGRYLPGGVFNCTNLMVKHSNEYRPPKPGETPKEMYKTLMKGTGS